MILRERLPDNFDPEGMAWVVECETATDFIRKSNAIIAFEANLVGSFKYMGRKVGFTDYQDALLFYLRFK